MQKSGGDDKRAGRMEKVVQINPFWSKSGKWQPSTYDIQLKCESSFFSLVIKILNFIGCDKNPIEIQNTNWSISNL